MEVKKNILVLVGPTASGKTAVSLALAEALDAEIISADSRQIYKYLDIGTAKPTPEQRRRVRHYFIDELEPTEEFSAGEFGERGRRVIGEIFGRGKLPIVVGGSGLYVRSLVDGLFEGPGADKEYRELLEGRVEREGIEGLMSDLRRVDPESASRMDPTKPRRVIRALEVFHLTGRPISDHHREAQITAEFSPIFFGLEWDRAALYRRIEFRCRKMIEEGLLGEVEELEKRGWGSSLNALNTVGYKEAFAYRRGELSYDGMVNLFEQQSRRYAKRQMTWFRADQRIRWIEMDAHSNLEETIFDAGEEILRLSHEIFQ